MTTHELHPTTKTIARLVEDLLDATTRPLYESKVTVGPRHDPTSGLQRRGWVFFDYDPFYTPESEHEAESPPPPATYYADCDNLYGCWGLRLYEWGPRDGKPVRGERLVFEAILLHDDIHTSLTSHERVYKVLRQGTWGATWDDVQPLEPHETDCLSRYE